MAEFPALPFWTDSYLADTRHLSTLEHGAYLLLLMEAWRRPTCSLPDDDKMLARLAGLSVHEWYEIKPTIMAFFTRDGRSKTMHQKRLTKERDFVARKSASQRDKVVKRWNKTKKDDTAVIPEQYRDDTPTPTPTPISSSLRSEDIHAAPADARARETPPQPPEGNGQQTFRERILAAMGLGPDGIAGPSKFIGNRADMAEAERWMALPGITEDIAVEEVARCMAGRQGAPPSKFRYFTPGMRALSAALTAPPLEPDTSGRTQPKSDRRRRDDEQRRFDAAINQLADGLAQGTVHIDTSDRDPFAFAAGKNAPPG